MSLDLLQTSAGPRPRLTRGCTAPRPKSRVAPAIALLAGLLLATTQASASLIVLDPGAQPLQDTGLAVAGDWIARPMSWVDKAVGWSLFPVNGQSCCVLGDAVVASAVVLAAPLSKPTAAGNVLSLGGPVRQAVPTVAPDAFGGPPSAGASQGFAQGEKNLRSMVAAGLARGADWSLAVALRDSVLPEFDLGHCGNNHAVCSTWVDSPEVIGLKRHGILGSRALAADHYLGASVSLPEIGAGVASEKR
jgi:hypothetical protein